MSFGSRCLCPMGADAPARLGVDADIDSFARSSDCGGNHRIWSAFALPNRFQRLLAHLFVRRPGCRIDGMDLASVAGADGSLSAKHSYSFVALPPGKSHGR
ncbi:uncharacterized protein PAN0_002c1457 [Moesziomyces antarcticus]|uniref:Uncharacterized protein n=1 Tax=Pseudozyma antarctica TaxID=84753 RepID=A0A5C3FHQ9_PSEA2|nr:uncharacterized protein PAN0_002c1457 [Moesziomyces antarcticus]GAK63253.1 hypothetical protein PAN0_002c1457 [Moesziomyces antarcticus]SPO43257.1 uncharacterized protein PSANT_00941 [Moesziomyces antarcticus]